MTIDKELFYASHGFEYPVVARPYTDDMVVREKFFTEADVVAMLLEVKDAVKHCEITGLWKANYQEGFNDGVAKSLDAIQQKINNLQVNNSKVKEQDDAEL